MSTGKVMSDKRLATRRLVELVQEKSLLDEAAENYLLYESIPATVEAFHLITRIILSDPDLDTKLQAGTFQAIDLGAGHNLLNCLLRENLGVRALAADLVIVESTNMIQCDFRESLPFRDCTFDLVTSLGVFEHVWTPCLFLAEQFRILKPGGLIYLSTPNFARLEMRLKLAKSVFFPSWPNSARAFVNSTPFRQHIREYTLDELLAAIRRACLEFEIVERGYLQAATPSRRRRSLGVKLIDYLIRPLKVVSSLKDVTFVVCTRHDWDG